ncbi:MAG: PilZ domain-containing protein [Gemmataceae bacterium]|nr:PilZ domain-containing protein [Gemmataceae bacterium]
MGQEQATTSNADRRIVRRRALKKGVVLTVRKGTMGLGPNLSIGGVDLSDDGIQVLVKLEVKKGDEIEIGLTGIGRSKPMVLVSDVRWCRPVEDSETFLVGVKLRRRLSHQEMGLFV